MCSLYPHLPHLKSIAYEMKPKIILLSETRTIENMNISELAIKGYNLFRCDAINRHTGGVAIYLSENISANVIFKYDNNYIWAIAINISKGFLPDIFCVVYRGHQCSDNDFINFFSIMCEKLFSANPNVHIVGDFNYNFNQNKISKEIYKQAKTYCLHQYVNHPTRETNITSTIIDWYLSSRKNIDLLVCGENAIADHKNLMINFFQKKSLQTITKTRSDWSQYNISALHHELDAIAWDDFYTCESVDSKCDFMFKNLEMIINKLIITRTIKATNTIKWFSPELANLKKEKLKAFMLWKANKTDYTWNVYKSLRNSYKNKLIHSEKEYIQNQLISNQKNSTKLWAILKSCYSNVQTGLNCLSYEDGVIISDSKINANKFNNYNVNSIIDLEKSIPIITDVHIDKMLLNNNKSDVIKLKFEHISEQIICKYVNEVKKKSFFDNINGNVLCDAIKHNNFKRAFCNLINNSLINGIFPHYLKTATIVPIQKVKNTIKCDEIRAINKLKVTETILEKIVRDLLYDHIESNNLFTPHQSGFRKKHSCETALNNLIHDWKMSLDKNKYVIVVFIDLKRAFETIDRSLLLSKLENFHCDNIVVDWFRSYFSNRRQNVKFNDALSDDIHVDIGIPQGSVLSCLLFLIFINDITHQFKYCNARLFADDTLIEIECDSIADGLDKINTELDLLYRYLCISKLSLNVKKTKAMLISNKKVNEKIELLINGETIEQVTEFIYLGVTLDCKLTFDAHTDSVLKKMNKKFYVFKRCEGKLNLHAKLIYYNSLVLPHIDSSGSILFLLNNAQIQKIQLVQNRFMRSVLKRDSMEPIQSMLDDLQWMSIKQRIHYNAFKQIHKIATQEAPAYLNDKIIKIGQTHTRTTRQVNEFYIPLCNKDATRKLLLVNGLRKYNHIIKDFETNRQINNISFTKFLSQYVKQNF